MSAGTSVRAAGPQDAKAVWAILKEAADWQISLGTPLWLAGELDEDESAAQVLAGRVLIAEAGGDPAGTIRFQEEDALFWPDLPDPGAAYVHRLAVRRRFAGAGVSSDLLHGAVRRLRGMGRRVIRLDTPADRPRLRAVYERFGFRHHSDLRVGPYFVSRYEFDSGPLP